MLVKEKEWKSSNQENLKKIEKLYKQLYDSDESNQKNTHKINKLTKAVEDNKKIIKLRNEQTKTIESNFNNLLATKDQKIQELLNKVNNLKLQISSFESKENSLAESQKSLDKKFNQLLETIKSK